MKKCASCTKDLPDAALHCVFCGAKQAPPPSSPMAKTVMGYGNDPQLEALRAQAAANAARASGQPYQPQPVGGQAPPRAHAPSQPPPPQAYPQPLAPAAAAHAQTMVAPPSTRPGPGPVGPAAANLPQGSQPLVDVRQAPRPLPYADSAPVHAGRPLDPWKDTLRLMMFLWGGLLIAAFVTPVSLEPLGFHWDAIIDGAGTAKLQPLILAAVGLLSVVLALLPLTSAARGAIVLVLALAGIFVPVLINGMPPWQWLVHSIGFVLLVPGLLVRHHYRAALLPRVLITVGVIAVLLTYLIPSNDAIPLVELFKGVIDAPGGAKLVQILAVVLVAAVVASLLSWLPSPAAAGAKLLAWFFLLFPLVMHAVQLFAIGDPSQIEASPYAGAMQWVVVGAVPMIGLGVSYLGLAGYGGAAMLGKQLE